MTKLGQSELRSCKQVTYHSNPVFLQHHSGWRSLDPKITRRISPRIFNKRAVQTKPSLCFVNNYATKSCVSGGTAPYILYLDTDASVQLQPPTAVLPVKETPVPRRKGSGGGGSQTTNPETPVVLPTAQSLDRLKCSYCNRRRSAPQLRRCKTIAQTK